MLSVLSRRLKLFWPELAKTVVVELSGEVKAKRPASRPRHTKTIQAPLATVEQSSDYGGPSPEAVQGEPPDEG